jgi:hypothetical protein
MRTAPPLQSRARWTWRLQGGIADGRVLSLPCTSPYEKASKVDGMDIAETVVRSMLTAIEAPLYDIGVLSHRGMLPGLEGIPAEAVLARLSLFKNRNARGSHIYIRPAGEHRYTALDDLSEISLARLAADGFSPCAVVETSAGNFQAWLKHSVVFPKLLSTFVAQTLAARYYADQVQRTGDVSADFQALPTANQNTEDRTDPLPLCD